MSRKAAPKEASRIDAPQKETVAKPKRRGRWFNRVKSSIAFVFRFARGLLRLVTLSIIAAIVALVVVIHDLDPNAYRDELAQGISRILGREVRIEGNLEWSVLSREPGIVIERVVIRNAEWGKADNLLEASQVKILVSFREIFNRTLKFDAIRIAGSNLNLEVSHAGQRNWIFGDAEGTSAMREVGQGRFMRFEFELIRLVLEHANARLYDFASDKTYTITSPEMTFTQYPEQPIHFVSRMNVQGREVYLNMAARHMKDGDAGDISGRIEAFGITADISGGSVRGQRVNLPNLRVRYKGAEALAILSVDMSRKLPRPVINATVRTDILDIPNLFVPGWEEEYRYRLANDLPRARDPNRPSRINEHTKAFGNVYLPIREFGFADGRVEVKIGSLRAMPDMPIDNIDAVLTVKDGTGKLSVRTDYMGGLVEVDVRASNADDLFNADVAVNVKDVSVGRIIDSTGVRDFFTGGNARAEVYARGRGKDLAEFMGGINGYAKIWTTSPMHGYRIERLFRAENVVSTIFNTVTLRTGQRRESSISCIVGNLNVTDGVTDFHRQIAIETATANIMLSGMVDFAAERMTISIASVVRERFGMSDGLIELVRITGPMAYPGIIIDRNQLADRVFTNAALPLAVGVVATGGIGLAAAGIGAGINLITRPLWGNLKADPHPCMSAFDGLSNPDEFQRQAEFREMIDKSVGRQAQVSPHIQQRAK